MRAPPVLFAQVFCDRIAWVMLAEGHVIGRGGVDSIDALRGVQVRAGIFAVVVDQTSGADVWRVRFGDEWRAADADDRAQMQAAFLRAEEKFA